MFKSLFINMLAIVFFCSPLFADGSDDLLDIDNQIEKLRHQQLKHRSQAAHDKNNADRWQFEANRFDEARRAYYDEELHLKMIAELQKQIELLEEKKANLTKDGKSA